MHQAGVVTCDQHLGPALPHVTRLVGAHRHRGVGVLHRERAAETAALVGSGSSSSRSPAPRAAAAGPVTDSEHPQGVAGRVVGHRVREVRADVLHAEHVDEELGELVDLRRQLGQPRASPGSPERRATMECWCRADPAHEPEGVTTASYPAKASTKARTTGTASSR